MLLRPAINDDDPWISKITKYIPAEILAVYTAVAGLLKPGDGSSGQHPTLYLAILIILFVSTFVWTFFAVKDNPNVKEPALKEAKALFHALVATIAFPIWVYALGDELLQGLLKKWSVPYDAKVGAIILILYTGLIVPLLEMIFLRPKPILQRNT
jgi:hypothetical protein